MTERHVRDGNRCLIRQRKLVRSMADNDSQLPQAQRLLALVERCQIMHLNHRHRLRLAAGVRTK